MILGKQSRSRSVASQPSDFSPALDGQKQSSETEHCFPHPPPAKNHKTTIIPAPASLKNHCNGSGDDRQVSQNGTPLCTGCTLSGRTLNLPGGRAPLEPLCPPAENKTKKRPPEVSLLHFQRVGEYATAAYLKICAGQYLCVG